MPELFATLRPSTRIVRLACIALLVTATLGIGAVAGVSALSTPGATTFYACLSGGNLLGVSTAPPADFAEGQACSAALPKQNGEPGARVSGTYTAWSQVGPQGSAGPKGDQGEPGPQGPPGPASPVETGTIVGYLSDTLPGPERAPRVGATVYLSGTAVRATTDAAGRFVLTDVPVGAWNVAATFRYEYSSIGANGEIYNYRSRCIGTIPDVQVPTANQVVELPASVPFFITSCVAE